MIFICPLSNVTSSFIKKGERHLNKKDLHPNKKDRNPDRLINFNYREVIRKIMDVLLFKIVGNRLGMKKTYLKKIFNLLKYISTTKEVLCVEK